MHPLRGEVYLVDFDPTLGLEVSKTRPALILQNDIGNRTSPLTIVAAITSKVGKPPFRIRVRIDAGEGGLSKPSEVMLNQIRSVDRRRLKRRLGMVSTETMKSVDEALLISLGLTDLGR